MSMEDVNTRIDGSRLAAVAAASRHRTACLRCRSARQRCDRLDPCSRCATQSEACTYPSGSLRGRKVGSTNKPDTVEKLLSRIRESPVGDQVVRAILESAAGSSSSSSVDDISQNLETFVLPDSACYSRCTHASKPKTELAGASAIDILASAVPPVEDNNASLPPTREPSSIRNSQIAVDDCRRYFGHNRVTQSDWEVLAQQSIESTFKLEPTSCDPIAARLINDEDAQYLFNQFFAVRNPLFGLLDPRLHTPEHVYGTSFTLFSTICALGCAVSTRPRDRIIYSALLSIAQGNMQWSIAVSVRSVEVVQAIIAMQYWAPPGTSYSSEPSWLHLCHATQLAREIGLDEPAQVDRLVAASILADEGLRGEEQVVRRNYERTWLVVFVADQTFGSISGRRKCFSWSEVPQDAFEWWTKPGVRETDRVISGMAEACGILADAFAEWKSGMSSSVAVASWHSKWYEMLEHLRKVRCTSDPSLSSTYLPLLAVYLDHGTLLMNARARKELIAAAEDNAAQIRAIDEKTATVARRILRSLSETVFKDCIGLHNHHLITICHAATEVVQALKTNIFDPNEATETRAQVRSVPILLDRLAQQLPNTSLARLCASLAHSIVSQLDECDSLNLARPDELSFDIANFSGLDWLWSWDGLDTTGVQEHTATDMSWGLSLGGDSTDPPNAT